jgi:hypothetical protein
MVAILLARASTRAPRAMAARSRTLASGHRRRWPWWELACSRRCLAHAILALFSLGLIIGYAIARPARVLRPRRRFARRGRWRRQSSSAALLG